MFQKKYLLNWHFIFFGMIGGFFLPILLMREGSGGEFLEPGDIIAKIARGDFFDEEFTTAIFGLFTVGFLINLLITCIKFKKEKLNAILAQLLGLAGIFVAMSLFCIFFKKILMIVCVIIGLSVVCVFLITKSPPKSRLAALWDLVYRVREKEDKMTNDQKRSVHARTLYAAMDQDKDEYDTSDIDQIMNDYDRQ